MKQAIVRLVVLGILLVNQALITMGWNPLPFSEEEIYQGVSAIITVVIAVWAWWKDNPVTKKAQQNEQFLKDRGMK
ncbi:MULTISPECIES: phage holin [Clostridia]|uniref:phage holin n=1 Tax=Clostridia TaxID=186801 RepID=UPI000EA40BDC|nr:MULTISPECIES: phage holin [Clostridia]NBJ68606.1 phage holin [Roseburia sp. 1XD42-34]RKI80711.1 phage holin [Clostridium sp. 1xD42-85]